MSEISYRTRKIQYAERSSVGDEFAEWLTGAFAEEYAKKISDYCKTIRNCKECHFYNGTCRLNSRPFNWDMKDQFNFSEKL